MRPLFLPFSNGAYGLLSSVYYDTRTGTYPYHPCPKTNYSYDNTSKKRLWLSGLYNLRSDGSTISSFGYLYDNVGNRTQMTEASGDYTTYGYDRSYRLRSEQRKTSGGTSIYTYDYQYDEIGNRKVKKLTNDLGTNTFTSLYSDNNLLSSITRNTTSNYCVFQYGDNLGRMTQKSVGISPNNRTWTFSYDETSRANSIDKLTTLSVTNPSQTVNFRYDVMGRRIEKTDSGGTARYVYDGDSLIAECDSSNNITAWYTPGICETRKQADGSWKTWYYSDDGLGSAREIVDDKQRVTNAYNYNAWGEKQGYAETDVSGRAPQKNPYQFVGKLGCYTDDDTGLVLMGARYYDPLIGRFITLDLSRDGMNWYEYAGDNPVGNVDPDGDKFWDSVKAAGRWIYNTPSRLVKWAGSGTKYSGPTLQTAGRGNEELYDVAGVAAYYGAIHEAGAAANAFVVKTINDVGWIVITEGAAKGCVPVLVS